MREVLHLTPSDARRVPWKNGRGVTEELALWPAESSFERGDFDWRISRASVKESGPFSSFPGFDRILVVTESDGLILFHGEHAPRARVRRLEPYRFAGEWPTSAELASGPAADFNLLLRRERADGVVQSLKLGRRSLREALTRGHAFVHVLAGEILARVSNEEEPFSLELGHSLWAREIGEGEELELVGAAANSLALLARIGDARA